MSDRCRKSILKRKEPSDKGNCDVPVRSLAESVPFVKSRAAVWARRQHLSLAHIPRNILLAQIATFESDNEHWQMLPPVAVVWFLRRPRYLTTWNLCWRLKAKLGNVRAINLNVKEDEGPTSNRFPGLFNRLHVASVAFKYCFFLVKELLTRHLSVDQDHIICKTWRNKYVSDPDCWKNLSVLITNRSLENPHSTIRAAFNLLTRWFSITQSFLQMTIIAWNTRKQSVSTIAVKP